MMNFSDFLDVVYYWCVRRIHDVKERKKFDRRLAGPSASAAARVNPTNQEEYVPDWWRGEEDAAQAGLAFARSLGVNIDLSAVSG